LENPSLRAQLSIHEQALLAVNALSTMGANWKTKGLFKTYQVIKNVPKTYFDAKDVFSLPAKFPEIDWEYEGFVAPEELPDPKYRSLYE
jgi:hypothetical protein